MKPILLVIMTVTQSVSGNVLSDKTQLTVTVIPSLEACQQVADQLNKVKNVSAQCFERR